MNAGHEEQNNTLPTLFARMATDLMVPPGLGDVKAHVYAQGGNEHEWRSFNHTRLYTNAFVIERNKVCLCALTA